MPRSMKKRVLPAAAGLTLLAMTLASCSGSGDQDDQADGVDTSSAEGTVDYWLWDDRQLPAYQACADAFQDANPDVTVNITQYSWNDYWTKLTNAFVAGTGPDVFTNHVSKYGDFVKNKQLLALDDSLTADGIDTTQYLNGLADLWKGPDGVQYGLPKDWDTIALFFNADLVEDAGYDADSLAALDWNPDDGGTYEEAIAHLTVDANGVRGDEPGFDKNDVEVYGLGLDGGSGGGVGQTTWSSYAGSTGWQYTDKNPWGTTYNYDDPRVQDTLDWFASLVEKGYMPSVESVTGSDTTQIFGAGRYALMPHGSWMINSFFGLEGVNVGIAPTPTGPEGRASIFNGLADSVWAGSDNKSAAVLWTEYLGSAECQDSIGEAGVVLPALGSGLEKAEAAFAERDIDVSPFTGYLDEDQTFLFPITENAEQINAVTGPAFDEIVQLKRPASDLTEVNEQVNAFFG